MLPLPNRRIPGAESRAQCPIRIEIGRLELMDQIMLRNYLRQLSSRLDVNLIPVSGMAGDLLASYQGQELRLSHAGQHTDIALPLRLTVIGEALTELLQSVIPIYSAAPGLTSLQQLLLPNLRIAGPVHVNGTGFGDLYFDEVYRHVWSALSPQDLHAALARTDGAIQSCTRITQEELKACIRESASHPSLVEEICWTLDTSSVLAPLHERWFSQDDVQLHLTTWPNLAHQPDYESWLHVLARARRPMAHGQMQRELVALDVNPARAADKIALLRTFRHLSMTRETPSPQALPTTTPSPARPGLLKRLRSRLRAMVS